MVYRGHIENGTVVLDEPADIPDGTQVHVEPVELVAVPRLAEQLGDVIGIVDDLPEDMAENHDHYIREHQGSDHHVRSGNARGWAADGNALS